MNKIARILYLLNHLSVCRGATASDLAKSCGVSERTVYRDVKCILQAGYPVYYDGGYRILKPALMPPGNLALDELRVIKALVTQAQINPWRIDQYVLQNIDTKVDRAITERITMPAPKRRLELQHRGTG